MIKNKKFAFTLAEVLITLGVIGVVSAITMPTLIQNYQKNVTVNRLKETYSILSQAVKMSEIDNGDIDEWSWASTGSEAHIEWVNKYLAPYLKYTKLVPNEAGTRAHLYLPNGVVLEFWCSGGNQMHVWVYLDGKINMNSGKNFFGFFIGGVPLAGNNKEVRPYDSSFNETSYYNNGETEIRDKWKNNTRFGCNKDAHKYYCAGLIMHDGWQIKDDYPW